MKNQKKAFYIILAVIIITGLIFSFFAYSKIRSIHDLRAAIEKSGTERAVAIEKDTGSSADVSKSIPQKMWTAEFIETAYKLSQKHGIRSLTFEQKTADSPRRQTQGKSRQLIQSYPVRMTFQAEYRNMADFILALQSLERLATIDSLNVRREKSSLAIELTASTYAMEEK